MFWEKAQKCKVSQGVCGIYVSETSTSFLGERRENEKISVFSEVLQSREEKSKYERRQR